MVKSVAKKNIFFHVAILQFFVDAENKEYF